MRSIELSFDQCLHTVGEFEGLALVWSGPLGVCRIAGAFELGLSHYEAASGAVVQQGIYPAVVAAIDERPNANRIF